MRKLGLTEMGAFVAVAERASFARAAADLGMPRSSLSETIRKLEEKLGVRLFNRTTRSVAVTDIGERLLLQIRPLLDNFDAIVESTNQFRDKPAGHLRLTVPRAAIRLAIEPILAHFLEAYPTIRLEISVDSALTDIVRHKFDAGIRLGHRVERDMIAVRLGTTQPVVVASPKYLKHHPRLTMPNDLQAHRCIRRRFASGSLQDRWTFIRRGKAVEIAVDGPLIVDDAELAARAAADGAGVSYLLEDHVAQLIAEGRLVRLLADWALPTSDFFLYYPSRRQLPAALQVFVDFMRARLAADRKNGAGPSSAPRAFPHPRQGRR